MLTGSKDSADQDAPAVTYARANYPSSWWGLRLNDLCRGDRPGPVSALAHCPIGRATWGNFPADLSQKRKFRRVKPDPPL